MFVSILIMSPLCVGFAQGLVPEVSLEDRIDRAENIIEGRIIAARTVWDLEQLNLYTIYTCNLLNVVKGVGQLEPIDIVTRGGKLDDFMQLVFPSQDIPVGQTGLLFLRTSEKNLQFKLENAAFELQFSTLSFIQYDTKKGTGFDPYRFYSSIQNDIYRALEQKGYIIQNPLQIEMVLDDRSPDAVVISSFTPSTISAGTKTELTINGTGFGSSQGSGRVIFDDADNGGFGTISPLASEYVSWSNTQIVVEVPNDAGTGFFSVENDLNETDESNTQLNVTYNLINLNYNQNAYRPNIVELSSGGIEFEFQTDFFNDPDPMNAFVRALNTWRCSNESGTGIYFIDAGSTTVDDMTNDGTNVVRFADNSELGGALAVTATSYSACFSGGDWVWYVTDIDLSFDATPSTSSYSWNYDEADGSTGNTEFDFESVAVHELGHAHLIDHSISSGDVMHYSIGAGDEHRAINDDEWDAGDDILSFSSGVCSQTTMTSGYVCTVTSVELTDFWGDQTENAIKLNATLLGPDTNNRLWLEKSINGSDFEEIGLMEMVGSENGKLNYKLSDALPMVHNYYKLKMEDADGNINYSKIIYLTGKNRSGNLEYFPNPITANFYLINLKSGAVSLNIIDATGQNILTLNEIKADEELSLDLNHLASGIYFMYVSGVDGNEIHQLIKQ